MNNIARCSAFLLLITTHPTHGRTDGQMEGQTDRQTDRQTRILPTLIVADSAVGPSS